MKNKINMFFLLFALILTASLIGCGDGSHTQRPAWLVEASEGAGEEIQEDVTVPIMECVSVVNYKKFRFAAATDVAAEDLTAGDITRQSAEPAVEAMAELSGARASSDVRECIEDQIETMKSGSKFYWGNRTYLITRDKIAKKPKPDTINIVDFQNCEQVAAAACLIIN